MTQYGQTTSRPLEPKSLMHLTLQRINILPPVYRQQNPLSPGEQPSKTWALLNPRFRRHTTTLLQKTSIDILPRQ